MPSSLDLSLPEGPRPKARLQLLPIVTCLLAAAILAVLLLGREAEAPGAKAPADAAEVERLRNLGEGLERRTLYSQAADVWGEYLATAALEPDQRGLIVYRRGKCLTLAGRHAEAIRYLSEADWLPLPSEQKREAGRLLLECLAAVGKIDVREELSRKLALGTDEEGSTVLGPPPPPPWSGGEQSAPDYFSTGTTIPRMMIFWQNRNTRKVGIAATRRAAKVSAWWPSIWSW